MCLFLSIFLKKKIINLLSGFPASIILNNVNFKVVGVSVKLKWKRKLHDVSLLGMFHETNVKMDCI